jgi:DNA-binding NtrC family response regulator
MKTIYILDTDSTQQQLMNQHLTAMGYKVRSVFSALEFDNLNEKPFMIILDEKMVTMDKSGMQFLKKINRRMSRVPVVYMMARPERKSISDAKKAGAYEVIEKNSAAFVNLRTTLDKLSTEEAKPGWLTRLFGKRESHDLPALSI